MGGHDLHTRFDDQAVKFLEQFGTAEEIDESELPPVRDLAPVHGTATQRAPAHLVDDDDAAASSPNGRRRLREAPAALRRAADAASADRPESSLEDDLDEADFFIQQSLFEEARSILESLLGRYPSHPLVNAKLRDLEAMERAAKRRRRRAEAEPRAVDSGGAEPALDGGAAGGRCVGGAADRSARPHRRGSQRGRGGRAV